MGLQLISSPFLNPSILASYPSYTRQHHESSPDDLPWMRFVTADMPVGYIPPPPPPQIMANQYCVDVPGPHDVLCGRGSRVNNHAGNLAFRHLVARWKDLYLEVNRRKVEKAHICAFLVDKVRSTTGGRFLKRDDKQKVWVEIGDVKARKKTGQALREDASEIRAAEAAAIVPSASPTVSMLPRSSSNSDETSMDSIVQANQEQHHQEQQNHNCHRASLYSLGDRLLRASVESCVLSYQEDLPMCLDYSQFLKESDRDDMMFPHHAESRKADDKRHSPTSTTQSFSPVLSSHPKNPPHVPFADLHHNEGENEDMLTDSIQSFAPPDAFRDVVDYAELMKLTETEIVLSRCAVEISQHDSCEEAEEAFQAARKRSRENSGLAPMTSYSTNLHWEDLSSQLMSMDMLDTERLR